jgi:hypothetical protein
MPRLSWSRSSGMGKEPAEERQTRRLSRSRPSPSRRQSPRGPRRGIVLDGRSRTTRSSCRSSVGGPQGCRRKGRACCDRHLGCRHAGANGQPLPPRVCGSTARCCQYAGLHVSIIRGSYAGVRVSKVVTLVIVVRHDVQQSTRASCRWRCSMR